MIKSPRFGYVWDVSPGNHALGSNTVMDQQVGCDAESNTIPCANFGVGHEVNPITMVIYFFKRKEKKKKRTFSEHFF